jgi:hypothetical protein
VLCKEDWVLIYVKISFFSVPEGWYLIRQEYHVDELRE